MSNNCFSDKVDYWGRCPIQHFVYVCSAGGCKTPRRALVVAIESTL